MVNIATALRLNGHGEGAHRVVITRYSEHVAATTFLNVRTLRLQRKGLAVVVEHGNGTLDIATLSLLGTARTYLHINTGHHLYHSIAVFLVIVNHSQRELGLDHTWLQCERLLIGIQSGAGLRILLVIECFNHDGHLSFGMFSIAA